MAISIDELQIEIQGTSQNAASGIDALTNSLTRLKNSVTNGIGLNKVAKEIENLNKAISKLDISKLNKISNFKSNLSISTVETPKVSTSTVSPTIDINPTNTASAKDFADVLGDIKTAAKPVTPAIAPIAPAIEKIKPAAVEATKHTNKFIASLKRILMYRVIRFILKEIANAMKEGVQDIAQYSKAINGIDSQHANETMSKISTATLQVKNSIGAALIPILNMLMPVIQTLSNWFITGANAVNQFFAAISGATTYTKATALTQDYANSLNSATDAAKDLKSATLGIDELNIISPDTGSSSAASATNYADMFEESPINELTKGITDKFNTIKAQIKSHINELTEIISGASLVIGTILFLTGANPAIGLALMVLGAIKLGQSIAAKWNSVNSQLDGILLSMTGMISGFSLVLGALLTFTGANIPLGIALLGIGVATLVSSIALNWNSTGNKVAGVLSTITGIVGGAALALGALFALTGVDIPLGIGFMLVGAVGITSAVALNWNSITDKTRDTISKITAIVGGAMLAIGAILTLTGVASSLGIPLMVVGASTLATTVALNWDTMNNKLRSTLTIITSTVGAATLAIGAILCFTGVGIPIGIGLMAVGAASLITAAALNWDFVVNKIKVVTSSILAILSGSLMVAGILLCLSGVGIGLGLAVLAAGLAGSYAAWNIDENPITNFVRKIANNIISIINVVIDAINNMFHISFDGLSILGEKIIPAFDVKLVNIPRIPTFATGGYPEDGQLFIANESGAEMVGSMNGRTTVANNDDIVRGISKGVYEAVLSAMNSANTKENKETNVNVYLDGREITSSVEQHQRERGVPLVGGLIYAR